MGGVRRTFAFITGACGAGVIIAITGMFVFWFKAALHPGVDDPLARAGGLCLLAAFILGIVTFFAGLIAFGDA